LFVCLVVFLFIHVLLLPFLTGEAILEADMAASDHRLGGADLGSVTTATPDVHGKEMSLNISTDFAGHLTYDARVKDALGAYSWQLTLNVFVLMNPCIHGDCSPRDPTGTCYEPHRAYSFVQYTCACDVGYEGTSCKYGGSHRLRTGYNYKVLHTFITKCNYFLQIAAVGLSMHIFSGTQK
jgi:hypothetical protein